MGSKLRLVRNANQSRRFRLAVFIVGCFVVSMTFLVVSRTQALVLHNLGIGSSSSPPQSGSDGEKQENLPTENNMVVDSAPDKGIHELTEETSAEAYKHRSNNEAMHDRLTLPTVSNYPIADRTQAEVTERFEDERTGQRKPLCDDSDRRADICDMHGDIRIIGNTSSVIFMESPHTEQKEVWQIHPYPRKGDEACFRGVREVTVRTSSEAPRCTADHDVPAIVFSTGGYAGNLFHDFTDVLVPLFTSARPFDGEVRFVVTDFKSWWITKFLPVLQKLSKYPEIDFDGDGGVHCFKRVTVGLRAHSEFRIDPARAPNGYSMIDFTKFMRSAFSVEREALPAIGGGLSARKPRLLIVSRNNKSRAFTNADEIVEMAEEMGFEVVVDGADVSSGLARFAGVVNSCDVMMGVLGTGLTNMVFLPRNATIIQIVPWGGLEWLAAANFGDPAKAMGLNYVEYSVSMEESSLSGEYPKDHPVFTDPLSFHNRGFQIMRSTFLDNQNLKLDVRRFRNVLWKVLERLDAVTGADRLVLDSL